MGERIVWINCEEYKAYLNTIEKECLKKAIETANNLDYSKMSDSEIECLINITVSPKELNAVILPMFIMSEKYYFSRIRKAKSSTVGMGEDWYREPPFDNKRKNRFDFTEKSILYTSLSQVAAIEEALTHDCSFVETIFVNSQNLKFIWVGDVDLIECELNKMQLTTEQKEKARIVEGFVKSFLMKNDGNDPHRLSIIMANRLFKQLDIDCIVYPSVKATHKNDLNVAFIDNRKTLDIVYATYYSHISGEKWFGIVPIGNGKMSSAIEMQEEYARRKKEVTGWYKKLRFGKIDRTKIILD